MIISAVYIVNVVVSILVSVQRHKNGVDSSYIIITTSFNVMHAIRKVPNGPLPLIKCYTNTAA